MYKIVRTDNRRSGEIQDFLVAENIEYEAYANFICESLLQEYSSPISVWFFKVVPQDYKLFVPDY